LFGYGRAVTRGRSDPVARLAVLERGATLLRRAGLGRAVDLVARRVGFGLGRFDTEVDGLRLGGTRVGHLYYARELLAGERDDMFRETFARSIRPGATVLEGGPYIGFFTLQAARAVGASGSVVTVEPNQDTLGALRANIARNGFEGRVRVVEAALGDRAGRASFHLTEGGDTSSLHRPPHSSRVVDVDVVRGDDVLERADVVKLDVEGNEVAALRGLRELIGRSQPTLFCECNPEMLAAAGSSVDELREEIERLGYELRWIDEETRTLRTFDEARVDGYVNLVCTPAGTGS